MPKIEDFLKKSTKKFSKTSEEDWKVDLTPPKINSRKRPGREDYVTPLPSPSSEQLAIDSVATRQQIASDSVAKLADSVATRQQTTPDSVATRQQIAVKHLRLGSKPVSDSVAKAPDSVAKLANSVANTPGLGSETTTATESILTHSVAKQSKNQSDSVAIPADSVATRQQTTPDSVATRQQTTPDSVATRQQKDSNATESTPTLLPSQKADSAAITDTDSVANRKAKKTLLPRSSHQVTLLRFLLAQQMNNDSINTPMLSRVQIAKVLGIDKGTLKNAIDRLVTKKLVIRNSFSNACTRGGTVFSVSNNIRSALLNSVANGYTDSVAKQDVTNSVANRHSGVGSSSLININTTTNLPGEENNDQDQGERFADLVSKLRLDGWGLGANDLLSAWRRVLQRKGLFKRFEDLEQSLEHLAFYLGTKDAAGLKSPKAWLLKELERGYYPAPAGFVSIEERREEERLADLRKRQERLGELRRQCFESEFDVWLSELPEARKKALAGAMNPGSRAALAVLRAAFAEEKNYAMPPESSKVPDSGTTLGNNK